MLLSFRKLFEKPKFKLDVLLDLISKGQADEAISYYYETKGDDLANHILDLGKKEQNIYQEKNKYVNLKHVLVADIEITYNNQYLQIIDEGIKKGVNALKRKEIKPTEIENWINNWITDSYRKFIKVGIFLLLANRSEKDNARNYYLKLESEDKKLETNLKFISQKYNLGDRYEHKYLDCILDAINDTIERLSRNAIRDLSDIRGYIKRASSNYYISFLRKQNDILVNELYDPIDETKKNYTRIVSDALESAFEELMRQCAEHETDTMDVDECFCTEILERVGVHITFKDKENDTKRKLKLTAQRGEYEKIVELLVNFENEEEAQSENLIHTYNSYQLYKEEAQKRAINQGIAFVFNADNVNSWLRQQMRRKECFVKLVNICNEIIIKNYDK